MKRVFTLALVVLFVVQSHAAQRSHKPKKRCVSPASAATYLKSVARPQSLDKKPGIRARAAANQNDVLVMEADPDLLVLSNRFDLAEKSINFLPITRGRYTFQTTSGFFDGAATQTIDLNDDDSYELFFSYFQFPFGKQTYDRCYINSNGNITFQQPDFEPPTADTLLNTPRIAGFFADLNPENQGGMLVQQSPEKVVVSWISVPEFFNQDQFDYGKNTFQIVMYADGRIHLVYSGEFTATQGFVGIISKTEGVPLRLVDFSSGQSRTYASLMENFHDYESIDIPLLMRSLYSGHPDDYDFVTLISNFDLTPVPGAAAFAINVRNDIRGIGDPSGRGNQIFKDNDEYGNPGRLQNITFLGNLHQYPSDPNEKISDLNSSLLELLAHEVGHRWLSFIRISEDGRKSNSLLGRDRSHWSFFLDTDGSFMEGNQIFPTASDSFETGSPLQRFSNLDLYLMGFLPAEEVSGSFYVADAHSFNPDFPFTSESAPEANIEFNGTSREFRIQDVIAANGPRRPNPENSQQSFRHLFVLVVKSDLPATAEELITIDVLRTTWESFFSEITGGKGQIDTRIE